LTTVAPSTESGRSRAVDVLIAGGGLVGASLALALAGRDLAVELVEAVPFGGAGQPSFDRRNIALSGSSQRILAGLGLWASVAPQAAPIHRIHVSEQGRFGSAVIDAAAEGVPALGQVIGSAVLGGLLWQRLQAAAGIAVQAPATVTGAERDDDGWRVMVDEAGVGSVIRPRLLVVADGGRSPLRTALGIGVRRRSYGQVAIIGSVGLARGRVGNTAWERFTPAGPLALLPAADNRYAFVVTRRSEDAAATVALTDADFTTLLQSTFGFRAGRFVAPSPRVAYPLELAVAEAVTAPRAVLVGNAAHGLHPVAGQGYNLGLRDVAALAELIGESAAGQGRVDPGADQLLATYASWRARDQRNVVRFTDGLVRAFGNDTPGFGALRGLALLGFDLAPGAKPWLAREAMGLGGRLPRLVRGVPL
jgi:2-octaprenyl-6-methoxyphenol hydroxylase